MGRARAWEGGRARWTRGLWAGRAHRLPPASWALQTLSVSTRGSSLFSKRGTRIFWAEPGAVCHSRGLERSSLSPACNTSQQLPLPSHTRAYTGARTSHPLLPALACAVLPTCTPSFLPLSFVALPSFPSTDKSPVLWDLRSLTSPDLMPRSRPYISF